MDILYASLAWSVAGFLLGWATCAAAVRIAYLDDRRMRSGEMSKSTRMDVIRTCLGVLILFVVLVSGIDYYRSTSCQTAYNEAVSRSLSIRADYQEREAEAQIKLLTTQTGGNREAARRALQEYIDALRDLDRARDENPVPPPPDCGRFR